MSNEATAPATRLELPVEDAQPLLPPGLWVVYLVAPVASALVLMPNLPTLPWRIIAFSLGWLLVPFAVITLSFHALFAWVVPRLVRRVRREWQRWLVYVAVIATVAPALGLLLWPLYPSGCSHAAIFAAQCTVITAVLVLPALVVQRYRVRALVTERLAMSERQASLRAQLAALTARTNPHFFFNAVNTVACLIPEDPALAERTLERLAELFRYALESDRTRTVPLARELDLLRDYLAIQAARFGAGLVTTVELDPTVAHVPVPPLLLQPLVENAVLHGVGQRGRGAVHVRAAREGDRVVVTVSDDGPGPGASTHKGSQTAVRDLLSRLALLYHGQSSFALESGPAGGCVARVLLPFEAAVS